MSIYKCKKSVKINFKYYQEKALNSIFIKEKNIIEIPCIIPRDFHGEEIDQDKTIRHTLKSFTGFR